MCNSIMKIAIITVLLVGLTSGQFIRRELPNDEFEKELDLLEPEDLTSGKRPNTEDSNSTSRRTASCTSFPGYVFWPGYDSYYYDLGRYDPSKVSLATMISSCTSNSECKGLNTNGYYKSYITPLNQWATWTSTSPCQGLYMKIPTSFKVNSRTLNTKEVAYLKWIAQWTVPYFGMSKFNAIRDYIAKGTWWTLKEGVLLDPNAYNYNLCSFLVGGKVVDKVIGPLETCSSIILAGKKVTIWQVGIAAVQVPNYSLASVEQRAKSVYGQDIPTVLGRSAQQAGYGPGTTEYKKIVASTGELRKAWLLKAHVVGFYFVATEVNNECLISTPKSWCYGTSWCPQCWYSPDAAGIAKRIDEVMVLLQSLTNGF
jgi:hypothetical protein